MRFFRGDAAFAIPALYKTLETAGYFYAIRLRANRVLQGRIGHLLKRPVGRPPKGVKRVYGDFEYPAASWNKSRRVVAKVEWHPGELFPRVGFVVTNLPMEPDWIIRFYNQRGTAEQHLLAHASIRCQAAHQGRQTGDQLDALVLQGQGAKRGPPSASCTGLQSWCLPAKGRPARGDGRLVANQPANPADQNRGEGCPSRPGHHVPTR
jgi:hypothetical protein